MSNKNPKKERVGKCPIEKKCQHYRTDICSCCAPRPELRNYDECDIYQEYTSYLEMCPIINKCKTARIAGCRIDYNDCLLYKRYINHNLPEDESKKPIELKFVLYPFSSDKGMLYGSDRIEVVNAETGAPVHGLQSISLHYGLDDVVTADIRLIVKELEVIKDDQEENQEDG